MLRLGVLLAILASPLQAETLVAARTMRAHAIITPEDVAVISRSIPGMLQNAEEAVGLETRVALYSGRPIRPEDVGPPAVVERNQIITLIYRQGTLIIATEARALSRAGVGDMVRVMNLSSRTTLTGRVRENGTITVGGPDLSLLD